MGRVIEAAMKARDQIPLDDEKLDSVDGMGIYSILFSGDSQAEGEMDEILKLTRLDLLTRIGHPRTLLGTLVLIGYYLRDMEEKSE